jgi:hypothetical protein
LICWTDVIKASHPGSLGHLSAAQRKRLEEAILEFLEEKLPSAEIALCKAYNKKKKEEPAIPENLVEEFGNWLDERMDEGMLDKANIEKRKRSLGGADTNRVI